MLGHRGIGTADGETPWCDVGVRCPHLLPLEHPFVAVGGRLARQAGEIAARTGSLNNWQQNCLAVRKSTTKRSFCSWVPNRSTAGAMSLHVTEISSWSFGVSKPASTSM